MNTSLREPRRRCASGHAFRIRSCPDCAVRVIDGAVEDLIQSGWKPRQIKRDVSASVDQAWAVIRPDPDPSLFDLTEAG